MRDADGIVALERAVATQRLTARLDASWLVAASATTRNDAVAERIIDDARALYLDAPLDNDRIASALRKLWRRYIVGARCATNNVALGAWCGCTDVLDARTARSLDAAPMSLAVDNDDGDIDDADDIGTAAAAVRGLRGKGGASPSIGAKPLPMPVIRCARSHRSYFESVCVCVLANDVIDVCLCSNVGCSRIDCALLSSSADARSLRTGEIE